jgi:hypothetical protein
MTDKQRQELRQVVEGWMESKNISGCPMCREPAWAFDSITLVFTPNVSSADIVAGRGRNRTDTSHAALLSRMREGRRILDNIRSNRKAQLIKLVCDNCGYVLLMDAFKVQPTEQ